MTKKEKQEENKELAKRDFVLKFGDGSAFFIQKGKEIKFTAPKGIDKEAVMNNLKNEGVL